MSYSYTANGETVVLEVDEDLVAVRFREPAPLSVRAGVAGTTAEIGSYAQRIEIPNEKFTILPVAQVAQPRSVRYQAAVGRLAQADEVDRVAPVFKRGSLRAVATDRLLLGVNVPRAAAKQLLHEYGLTVLEEFGAGNEFLVQLPPKVDPFVLVEELGKLKEITYVEPDFVVLGARTTQRPPGAGETMGDPLLPEQYAAQITGAVEAWKTTTGNPAIRIAVLDEGVDTRHEDLAAAVVGGYDAAEDDAFQEPNAWDGHGTACAGLAAAAAKNGRGVRGIGAGCSLLAVRIAYTAAPAMPGWVTNSSWIRRGIDWAWRNGADVLSNSWGGGLPSSAITEAYTRARHEGRGGKGCVVVTAAGNDSGPVNFPATLPGVLAVSASNEFDEFKTILSRDGETWWGSNFGPEVALAAPGVHNYTTDITGASGYNTAADGHYSTFNGTSSATPIVAGAAGLLLSANPNLTEEQVRRILCATADKVGARPYFDGRNDEMGYGRLNVARAVAAAQQPGHAQSAVPSTAVSSSPNGSQPAQPEGSSAPAPAQELAGAELTPEALAATELTLEERSLLVEQALALIDNFYVHLPLKRAMHAVDPIQRLKLLKHRLPRLSERRFHDEMLTIFTCLRDLHTSYLLPEPYNQMGAYLPFLIEEFYVDGRRCYMASRVASGFQHPTFAPGVTITHWNGIPIEKAVANNAERNAGSNEEARRARGVEGMTVRPLMMTLPPDEEWVDVRYSAEGATHDLRFTWRWLPLGTSASSVFDAAHLRTATTLALDVQTEAARRMKKTLFSPTAMQIEEQVAGALAAGVGLAATLDLSKVSVLPDNFRFRTLETAGGPVGLIRIYSFYGPVEDPAFVERFVAEFMRILALLPPGGLIIDVRGNGGGYITAGEKLLQMLTSKAIEPERLHFVNTPLTQQLCAQTEWLAQWAPSVQMAVETGDIFSQGFPAEPGAAYNTIGQKYTGPVVLITDALCYSTTDIFAAGFQDHNIGPILGVHGNTGAGGANVWPHPLLRQLLPREPSLRPLPRGANFQVAIRRTSRVGERAGLPVEDLGVIPDHQYARTRRDLLEDNVDLLAAAASLLRS